VKVVVNEDKCCGAGTCVLLAPEVFDQREDDGIVTLLDEQPPERLHDTVRECANVCPGAAIAISAGT
jgi:ferredoxin